MPPVRVFISYSHKDRKLAKQVKRSLITFGVNVFLAHDDIEASAQWSSVIMIHRTERSRSAEYSLVIACLYCESFICQPSSPW